MRELRAVRGATTIEVDQAEHVLDRTAELLSRMLVSNGLVADDLVSLWFTATPDVRSVFPAAACERVGLVDVPAMCASEMNVDGGARGCIRVLAHVRIPAGGGEGRPEGGPGHVYLHGAAAPDPERRERTNQNQAARPSNPAARLAGRLRRRHR